jgi:tetratricopeptide (TPR) repeat protein
MRKNKRQMLFDEVVSLFQQGHYDRVISLLQNHINKKKPIDFKLAFSMGSAFAAKNAFEEGRYWLDKALEFQPTHREALLNRGRTEKKAGCLEGSSTYFERILEVNPRDGEALNELGDIAYNTKNRAEAERLFEAAVQGDPQCIGAYSNLAIFLMNRGEFDKAYSHITHVISHGEDNLDTLKHLAFLMHKTGKSEKALEIYQLIEQKIENKTLSLGVKELASIYSAIGLFHMEADRLREAFCYYQKALKYDPLHVEALINLAMYSFIEKDYLTMDDYFLKLITLYPDAASVCDQYANILRETGKSKEALLYHQKAIELEPDNVEFVFLRSLTELDMGLLAEGWRDYCARYIRAQEVGKVTTFKYPVWAGETHKTGSLLICKEQGVGDEIMFSSMLPDLKSYFQDIVYACSPKLITLFSRSFPYISFAPYDDQFSTLVTEKFDAQMFIGGAAQFLRSSINCFPDRKQFLYADPIRVLHWKERFSMQGSNLKVGVSWRSGSLRPVRRHHYPLLEDAQPIFSLPGIDFINVQYQCTDIERNKIKELYSVSLIDVKQIDFFDDLDAAACVLSACDVVIGPVTCTTVLAASLGVPTISMEITSNPFHLGQLSNPWFPAMISIKKDIRLQWVSAFEQAANILGNLAKEKLTRASQLIQKSEQ